MAANQTGSAGAGKGALVGWLISGVLVLIVVAVVCVVLWMRFRSGGVGEPTAATTGAGALEMISMELDIGKLVEVPGGGGAEKIYNEAIKTALNGQPVEAFAEVAKNPEPLKDARLKTLCDLLVRAGDAGMDSRAEWVSPELKMGVLTDLPTQRFLIEVGHVLTNAALEVYGEESRPEAERKAAALKLLRAGLLYGNRLWHNGVYGAYKYAGISVLGDVLAQLQSIYKDGRDAEHGLAAMELDGVRRAAGMKWLEKDRICHSLKPVPGDLANLLEHDRDRAWRIQGGMWLGVAQWVSADGANRAAIKKLLEKYSLDGDRFIAEQAGQALRFERGAVQELGAQGTE